MPAIFASGQGSLASSIQQYPYQQLKGQYMIRLLELQPTVEHDSNELFGRLIDADLRDGPSFEAISYTWGAPVFDHTLRLPEGYLKITENLASALTRFRPIHSSAPRILWTDQICINQADTLERNQQVSIMGEIYRNANRVLTWLGPGNGGTHAAVIMLKAIASSAEKCGIREMIDSVDYFPGQHQTLKDEEDALRKLAADNDFAKLKPFFEKSWFSRMWICQEIALPSQVDFFCGDDQISFHELAMSISVISKMIANSSIQTTFPMGSMIDQALGLISLREIQIKRARVRDPNHCQSSGITAVTGAGTETTNDQNAENERVFVPAWNDMKSLDYIAKIGCENLCTDDRDRVYAFISLQSDDEVKVNPDYRKSVGEVYADFARHCLASQDIRILHYAGLALRSKVSTTYPTYESSPSDLPSWTPDWRVGRPIHLGGGNRKIYSAGTGVDVLVRTEENNPCIDVSGAFVDIIEAGQKAFIEGFNTSQPLNFSFETSRKSILGIRAFLDSHRAGEKYPTGEEWLTAFARTVTGDLATVGLANMKGLLKDPQNSQELVNIWLLFEKVAIKPDGELDLDQGTVLPGPTASNSYSRKQTVLILWLYMTSVAALLKDRQFFITRQKYIGLAPAMSEAGDLIALIGGCQAPFVLRPDHEKQIFRIVGECYLHGFMNGELLTDAQPRLTFTVY